MRAPMAAVATLALLALAAGPQVHAQPATSRTDTVATDGPSWASLTTVQKQALAPLAQDWHRIDAPRKAKWLEVAARYPRLSADEQGRLQARMTEWARMTPQERTRARHLYQESKGLSPQEKQDRWEAYRSLPDDEREALAKRSRLKNEGARAAPAAVNLPAASIGTATPKQNVVTPAATAKPLLQPVAPTVLQAQPGATTRLMTKPPTPPAHQQPGQPKIAGKPGEVDRSTLLPKKGPQAPAAAASAASRP